MKPKILLILSGIFFSGSWLSSQTNIIFTCPMDNDPEVTSNPASSQSCNFSLSNLLTNHSDDMVPEGVELNIKIKTNVIFVQDGNGKNMFSVSNPAHMDYWNKIFANLNARMENMVQGDCHCTAAPVSYQKIHIEFVPRLLKYKVIIIGIIGTTLTLYMLQIM